MAQLRAIVTKSFMDELLYKADKYRIIGIRQHEHNDLHPVHTSVTATCEPEFFEKMMIITQATLTPPHWFDQGFDFLEIIELEPDAGYISQATRSVGFYTDRVNGVVL